MQVTEELVKRWEPKIHSMIKSMPVYGLEREDLEQELRLTLLLAARRFDSNHSAGASFYTYLNAAMVNKIIKLREKQSRDYKHRDVLKNDSEDEADSAYGTRLNVVSKQFFPGFEEVQVANGGKQFYFLDFSVSFLVSQLHLTSKELLVVKMSLQGYKKGEVARAVSTSYAGLHLILKSLRQKFTMYLGYEE